MLTLYDNPFSPFARKVRMVLFWKNLSFESVDALALARLDDLGRVNPRREVPVLVDRDIRVVNSADIVDYLDHRYGPPLALPGDPLRRVEARRWERLADGLLDAILHDVSLWMWPTHQRRDAPPAGLVEAGRRDLDAILALLETEMEHDFLCGALSIADIALFPHVASLRVLGWAPDPIQYPRICDWLRRLRALAFVQRDLDVVRRAATECFSAPSSSPYEPARVVWRGDRLEWLLAHGFAQWWLDESQAGRALVPRSL